MRLLWFNLAMDLDDPILGFATRWVQVMAKRVEAITVITMRAGRVEVPENVQVYSVGKEKGYSEPRRALEFYRHVFRVLQQGQVDVVFAHMIPVFAILAAPVVKPRRIPMVLWYTHKAVSWKLRLAHRFVDRVVTASPESFPLKSSKVRVIGHGIDTDRFKPAPGSKQAEPFTVLTVGRLSPIKHVEVLLRAAHLLVHEEHVKDVRFVIVGGSPPGQEMYAEGLKRLACSLGLEPYIRWVGPVSHEEVVRYYQESDLFVNLSATDSVDKAVLEAIACGVPVLTANRAFQGWADGQLFIEREPRALARRMAEFYDREKPLPNYRQLVEQEHALDTLVDRLIRIFAELTCGL